MTSLLHFNRFGWGRSETDVGIEVCTDSCTQVHAKCRIDAMNPHISRPFAVDIGLGLPASVPSTDL